MQVYAYFSFSKFTNEDIYYELSFVKFLLDQRNLSLRTVIDVVTLRINLIDENWIYLPYRV